MLLVQAIKQYVLVESLCSNVQHTCSQKLYSQLCVQEMLKILWTGESQTKIWSPVLPDCWHNLQSIWFNWPKMWALQENQDMLSFLPCCLQVAGYVGSDWAWNYARLWQPESPVHWLGPSLVTIKPEFSEYLVLFIVFLSSYTSAFFVFVLSS